MFLLVSTCLTAAAVPSGEIILSLNSPEETKPGFRALIEAYREVNPGVEVKLELKGGNMGIGYPTWLNTQLTTGAPRPDIVASNLSPRYMQYLDFDYYREVINPHTGNRWEEDLDFNFYELRNKRGERIMLPTQSVKVVWYYNKTVFEKLGLTLPATWSEFLVLCQRIRDAGYTPLTLKFNLRYHQWLARVLWDQYSRESIKLIRARPGDWCYKPEIDEAWRFDPTDPFNDSRVSVNPIRLLKAVRDGDMRYDTTAFKVYLANLKSVVAFCGNGFFNSTQSDAADSYASFLRQESLIHLDVSSLITQITADIGQLQAGGSGGGMSSGSFEWGIFDTPSQVNKYVVAPARAVESAGGEYIGIIEKSPERTERVVDFVMFWLSRDGYQAYVDGLVAESAFRPSGRVVINGVRVPDFYSEIFKEVKPIGSAVTPVNLLFKFPPLGSRYQKDLLVVLGDYLRDKASIDETVQRIQLIMEESVGAIMESYGLTQFNLENPHLKPRP
jgi:ABC-type glycerol-3-phosphate transport system substrate-binding protein